MSEEDIIKLFEKTLSGIYRRHLHRTAVRFVSNCEDVEDLTQKTILKAVKAFSKGVQLRNPKAWLLRS
jgi:DNA-directed RNA polymerase specialized sigma24 family protein